MNNKKIFREGMRDGLPIGLGYLAVSFSLGITARNIGLTPFQGFLVSLLNNASAGEYAGFTVMAADAAYIEIIFITFITNIRYLLMSCALSQRFSPDTPLIHRFFIGYDVTDELFGITIARKGYLNPCYTYGAMLLAIPGWSIGTAIGVMAGNILPARIVGALSVALFGMFIAIIIPPAKKNPINVALFESWSVALSELNERERKKLVENRKIVLEKFASILKNHTYSSDINTAKYNSVKRRLETIVQMIQEVLKF